MQDGIEVALLEIQQVDIDRFSICQLISFFSGGPAAGRDRIRRVHPPFCVSHKLLNQRSAWRASRLRL